MAHSEAFRQQRRKLILAGVAAGGLGTAAWLRPPAIRDGHSDYFRALSRALVFPWFSVSFYAVLSLSG